MRQANDLQQVGGEMKHKCTKAGHPAKSSDLRARWQTLCSSVCFVLMGMLATAPALGQSNFAGRSNLFELGAGARAIGLGGATVAQPIDATTIFWNPAGLDLLQRKNAVLFYATLLGGTKYNFIGYAYPTLQLGTIGVGVLHWDVDGINLRDDIGIQNGEGAWSEYQFLVSYAKELPFALSLGGSIKLHRQSFTDYDPASGVGLDFGMLYRPELGDGVFQNLSFGLSIQNLIVPRLKLNTETDVLPRVFRAGFARPIRMGERDDFVNLFFTLKKSNVESARLQFGSEYVYQNRAMLRFGSNGSGVSFGGGLVYEMFEIDYAAGKYSSDDKDFAIQHRVSMTIRFGKSKAELFELAQQREQEQLAKKLEKERLLTKQTEFTELMQQGRTLFQQQNYYEANLRFAQARRLFPADREAKVWVDKSWEKYQEQEQIRREELQRALAEKQDSIFVASQLKRGREFLDAGEYGKAIRAWEDGLARDPNNPQLLDLIRKTEAQITNQIQDLLRGAQGLEARGKLVEAVQAYGQVLNSEGLDSAQRAKIRAKISELQRRLNFNELYTQGVSAYLDRNYGSALDYFRQALEVEPNNKLIQKYIVEGDEAKGIVPGKVKTFLLREVYIYPHLIDWKKRYTPRPKYIPELDAESEKFYWLA